MKNPKGEALKEVFRWALFAAIAWVISETLQQANVIPEVYKLHIWVFTYTLPLRELLVTLLTLLGRGVDKYLFEVSKDAITWATEKPKGLLPW